jgi:hypothetical protein
MLIAQLFAGPYVAEIHHHRGWFLRRYEVEIWGDGDYLCYKIKSAVRETLHDLAARAERALSKNAELPSARAGYAKAYGQPFIELCRETAAVISHLARGHRLEGFPGYRLAPDDHHHVFFKGLLEQQKENRKRNRNVPVTATPEDQVSTNNDKVGPIGAQIIAAATHRNGISGAPFGVLLFEDYGEDGSRKVGIWFEPSTEGCHCAVLDVDKLAAGDIASMSNSWRGDHYDPMLRTVIEQIGREERWRPVFGPDYWKQQKTPGPNLEPRAPHHRKHDIKVSKLDVGHAGEQQTVTHSHQSFHEPKQAYPPKDARPFTGRPEDEKSPGKELTDHEQGLSMGDKDKVESGNGRKAEARLACGAVRGSIRVNRSEQEGEYITVSIARVFKGPDGAIKTTHSYELDDLSDLSELALGAKKFIQDESVKLGQKQHAQTQRVRITR